MSITLSDSAAARVNAFLANRGKGFGLRLGVRTSGCSGMAYVLEFVDEPAAEDTVFEDKGVKVVIDGKSLQFLDGKLGNWYKIVIQVHFKIKLPYFHLPPPDYSGQSVNIPVPVPSKWYTESI